LACIGIYFISYAVRRGTASEAMREGNIVSIPLITAAGQGRQQPVAGR